MYTSASTSTFAHVYEFKYIMSIRKNVLEYGSAMYSGPNPDAYVFCIPKIMALSSQPVYDADKVPTLKIFFLFFFYKFCLAAWK